MELSTKYLKEGPSCEIDPALSHSFLFKTNLWHPRRVPYPWEVGKKFEVRLRELQNLLPSLKQITNLLVPWSLRPCAHQTFRMVLAVSLSGLCWRIDVGRPLFTLLQPEMLMDGARSGRCDQPLRDLSSSYTPVVCDKLASCKSSEALRQRGPWVTWCRLGIRWLGATHTS